MPKFTCQCTRMTTDVAEITIEADSEDEASINMEAMFQDEKAMERVEAEWELEDVVFDVEAINEE